MPNKMNLVYESIEGNTDHFVHVLSKLFKNVNLIKIDDQSDVFDLKKPFFCFVPTYVHGNHDRYHEIDTLAMHDELSYHQNFKHCLGFIGSGNRNFGVDCYCWTARYYSEIFHCPMVANYELSGTNEDANDIDKKLVTIWNKSNDRPHIMFKSHHQINPRLKKLEQKYGNLQ